MDNLSEVHAKCLYPEVRIRTDKALGSGTVLFCEPTPDEEGMWDAYVLTNEHVVDNLIKVVKRWDSVLRREVKIDVLGHPTVERFSFAYKSRVVGSQGLQADIVAYDKEDDLALLRVRSPEEFKFVAELYPEEEVNDLVSFMPVWNVGCGMGKQPAITFGYLSGFGVEIENKDYFLVTAPMIFGNSGGATFLQDTCQFIGVPARITVTSLGWSADVVTHLGFSITVARVYQFLRDQIFCFIFDPCCTSTECEEERKRKREEDRLLRTIKEEREE